MSRKLIASKLFADVEIQIFSTWRRKNQIETFLLDSWTIPYPFKLIIFLRMPYIYKWINVSLCSIIFPNIFSFMRKVVSIYDLLSCEGVFIFLLFHIKMMRVKSLLLYLGFNSTTLFISFLMTLIPVLCSLCFKLFRAKLLLRFSFSYLFNIVSKTTVVFKIFFWVDCPFRWIF